MNVVLNDETTGGKMLHVNAIILRLLRRLRLRRLRNRWCAGRSRRAAAKQPTHEARRIVDVVHPLVRPRLPRCIPRRCIGAPSGIPCLIARPRCTILRRLTLRRRLENRTATG